MKLLFLALLVPIFASESAKDGFAKGSEKEFLYKVPSRELAGHFTAPPGQNAINLNFDLGSEEKQREVRRSPEVRLPQLGGQTVLLEDIKQERALRDILAAAKNAAESESEIGQLPRFEQGLYDFMVPEGKTKKSSEVAEVMFFTEKGSEQPEFKVTLDRLNWFQIGKVVTKERENYIEYQVAVNLQPNADIRVDLTKDSTYKFAIEANQGEATVISRVRVDILAMGSMTIISTTEEPSETETTASVPTVQEATTPEKLENQQENGQSSSSDDDVSMQTSRKPEAVENTVETTEQSTVTGKISTQTVIDSEFKTASELTTEKIDSNQETQKGGTTTESMPTEQSTSETREEKKYREIESSEDKSLEVTPETAQEDQSTEATESPEKSTESFGGVRFVSTGMVSPARTASRVTLAAQPDLVTQFDKLFTTQAPAITESATEIVNTETDEPKMVAPVVAVQNLVDTLSELSPEEESTTVSNITPVENSEEEIVTLDTTNEVLMPLGTEEELMDVTLGKKPLEALEFETDSAQGKSTSEQDDTNSKENEQISSDETISVNENENAQLPEGEQIDHETTLENDSSEMEKTIKELEVTQQPVLILSMPETFDLVEGSGELEEGSGTVQETEEIVQPESDFSVLEEENLQESEVPNDVNQDNSFDASETENLAENDSDSKERGILSKNAAESPNVNQEAPELTSTAVLSSMEKVMEEDQMVQSTIQPVSVTQFKSSEDENPLTDTVTVATEIMQSSLLQELEEEQPEAITISLNGTENGLFVLSNQLSTGNLLRGLVITTTAMDTEKSAELISLSLDRSDLFTIRPSKVQSGGHSYLFIHDPLFEGEVNIKITAVLGEETVHKSLTIRNVPTLTSSSHAAMTSYKMSIREDAPSGTTVGKVPKGKGMQIIGLPGRFALVGEDIILACPDEQPCLDREKQDTYFIFLSPADGSEVPYQLEIQVEDVNDNAPKVETTDSIIRISDNKLIMPFGIEILDSDTSSVQKNRLIMGGSASLFLAAQKIEDGLYQLNVAGPTTPGRYELELTVTDNHSKDHKLVRVLVQKTSSKAHFRRTRYERNIHVDKIVQGNELLRVELEGVPIDEATFVLLKGNPGWLSIEDYGGTVNFAKYSGEVTNGQYDVQVAAVDRATGRLLADTRLIINVVGGSEGTPQKVFEKEVYERTLDRETAPEISLDLDLTSNFPVLVDQKTVFALDENGQTRKLSVDDIAVHGDKVVVKRDVMKDLRIIRFDVVSESESATVVFHLASSDEYIEHRQKMAARPVFSFPWTQDDNVIKLSFPEELPIGHIVAVLPATNPINGDVLSTKLEGSDKIIYDEKTGALRIARRLDFDRSSVEDREFRVRLVSGEEGYESTADVRIQLEDVDDNAPVIDRQGLPEQIVLPENLPPGTPIAKISVDDIDEVSQKAGLGVRLTGPGSAGYHATVTNGTVTISVAPSVVLDREHSARHSFVLRVHDIAGHEDSIPLTISLSDENDNAPKFNRSVYNVQAVENWPAGVVLDRLEAFDPDQGERGAVTFSLASHNSKYFSINSSTGEFFVSRDLMGLAREEPYQLTAFAHDGGNPSLNSSVTIRVKVREPFSKSQGDIVIETPEVDYTLNLKENVPKNEKVYQVKAHLANAHSDRKHIRYEIEELNSEDQSFEIDEATGEVMILKELDYEKQKEHVLLTTVHHVLFNTSASRILRVNVENVNDNEPEFKESSPRLFWVEHGAPIGRLSAKDKDGDLLYYYLLPKCSRSTRYFTIDKEFGEVSLKTEDEPKERRTVLCAIASSDEDLDVSNIEFDENRKDMTQFVVQKPRKTAVEVQDLSEMNNTRTIVDTGLFHLSIPIPAHYSENGSTNANKFSIRKVEFTPSTMVPPRTPMDSLSNLFTVNPDGSVRVSPQLSDEPEGVYKLTIDVNNENGPKQTLVKEFHLVHHLNKLKYVFDMPVAQLSKIMEPFRRKLDASISADHPEGTMNLMLDRPVALAQNSTRSSICFHTVLNGTVLSDHSALAALSQENVADSKLAQVYQNFSIIDIEKCDEVVSLKSASSLSLPLSSLALVAVLAALTLILFIMIVYCCLVKKYKNYLHKKEKTMKAQPVSPRMMHPPSPTFVLAPATVPPMNAIGYWDA